MRHALKKAFKQAEIITSWQRQRMNQQLLSSRQSHKIQAVPTALVACQASLSDRMRAKQYKTCQAVREGFAFG